MTSQILLVDDNKELLAITRIYLEEGCPNEFVISIASSGKEALTKINDNSFDIVVADYQMEGMDGLQLLKNLRREKNDIPFIMFTGRGREEVVIQALNIGADSYIQKGGDPKAQYKLLVHTIRRLISHKKSENQLKFEHSQLLSIFDSFNGIISVSDPNTYEILYINKFFRDVLGKEVTGKKCYEEFQGFNSPCDFCTNDLILKLEGKPNQWEFCNPSSKRVYIIMDRIIKWPDGRFVRFEIAINITKRKKTEDALKKSRKMLQLVIDNIPQYVFWKDRNSIYLGCNKTFARVIGQQIENIIGKSEYDLDLTEEEQKLYLTTDRQVMDTDTPQYHIMESIVNKKGKRLIWDTSKIPLHDDYGNVIGVLGTVEDVSEQKKTIDALRKSEEQYRATLDGLDVPIHVVNTDLNILLFNKTFYEWNEKLGLETDVIGKNICQVFPFADEMLLKEEYQLVIETKKPHKVVSESVVNGKIFLTETKKIPIVEDGKVNQIITVVRDITNRQNRETSLEERNKTVL